jgi:mannose-6-phosphate isomerase-like protein (cupin superfamily)
MTRMAEGVGRCIMMFSYVDWIMALVLAAVMKAESEASVAIFLTLRNARAQRDLLIAAAEMTLDFPITDRLFESYYAEFPLRAKPSELHRHEGAELVYVLKGQLAVSVDEQDTILQEGDAMYFDASAPHSYRRDGRSACTAIVVVAPQPK